MSKDGGRITETELRTLKYISENYYFTPKAAAWFVGKLADIENAVNPDQFDHTQPLTQQHPELDQASSPLPEKYLSTVTTTQLKKFTPVEEPIVRISHLIWGILLSVSILVGVVLYQGAIKEIETLELKLSAVPSIQELEQQDYDVQRERSALQTSVSELKKKVAETNSEQAQYKKRLRAEKDRLSSVSSKITKLRSEVQDLRGERSALQTIVIELKQKVAEQGPVCSPSSICVW